MNTTKLMRLGAVGVTCAALGAGAGVLTSAGAAPSKPAAKAAHGGKAGKHRGKRGAARLLRRAVHVSAVVPTDRGSRFATATFDRGTVTAVGGDSITLREGTRAKAYRSVTLTIPSGARVRDNGRRAKLSDISTGERAMVLEAPKRTSVRAHDAHPDHGHGRGRHGR